MHFGQIADTGKLGLQQLKYPANIPPRPRPNKKIPRLTYKFKKIPRRDEQIKAYTLFTAANMLNPPLVYVPEDIGAYK